MSFRGAGGALQHFVRVEDAEDAEEVKQEEIGMATFAQIVGECELCSADEAARATRPLSSFGIFLTLHSSTGSKCHLHQGTVCTRLCKHEILTRLLDRFPDGQWYVSEAQDEAQDEAALRQDAGPSEGDDEDEESPL